MGQPNTVQQDFRWRNDDDGEADATWIKLANTDLDDNPTKDVPIRIRFNLQNTGSKDEASSTYGLEYRINGVTWTTVTTTSSYVKSVGSANTTWTLTDEDSLTQQLGSGTFDEGYWDDTGVTGAFVIAQGQEAEVEYCIQFVGSDIGADTIELRVVHGGAALDGYSNTPSTVFTPIIHQPRHPAQYNIGPMIY